VVGVTPENIDEVNSAIASLTPSDVDTTEEIQGIVDTVIATTQWDTANWDELKWQ